MPAKKTPRKRGAVKSASPKRSPAKRSTAKHAADSRPAASRPAASKTSEPLFQVSDIRTVVRDLAGDIAPGDVEHLLAEEANLRAQSEKWSSSRFPRLTAQLNLGLDLLRDFHSGACPQIPYSTISLIGGAVTYYANSLDLIPDFLGGIGRLDDAAVMEVACRMAAGGLRRYCVWREIDANTVIPPQRRLMVSTTAPARPGNRRK